MAAVAFYYFTVIATNEAGSYSRELSIFVLPHSHISPPPSATATPQPSPSATATPQLSPDPPPSATATPQASPSQPPSATPTPSPSVTASPEPSPTAIPSPSPEVSPSPQPTIVPSPSPTPTSTTGRRYVNRNFNPRAGAGRQQANRDVDETPSETVSTTHTNDGDFNVIYELTKILQNRNLSEADINFIIDEVTEALVNYEGATIELNTLAEKIMQILSDFGLNENEINGIAREFVGVIAVLIRIRDGQLNEAIIRAPVGRTTVYRTDNSGINWEVTNMDTTTFIAADGTVMVSIRFMTYAMRAQVQWNSTSSSATLSTIGTNIQLMIGSATMIINGHARQMFNNRGLLAPAYLRAEHNRIFIPISAVGEAFNIEYRFDNITQEAVFYLSRPLN